MASFHKVADGQHCTNLIALDGVENGHLRFRITKGFPLPLQEYLWIQPHLEARPFGGCFTPKHCLQNLDQSFEVAEIWKAVFKVISVDPSGLHMVQFNLDGLDTKQGSTREGDYYPVSLLTSVYKIFTKILTNRMALVICWIVGALTTVLARAEERELTVGLGPSGLSSSIRYLQHGVGFIRAGEAPNVIPDSVTFGGTFRSMKTEGFTYLSKRIKEVIETQAAVHHCTAMIEFMENTGIPYPATVNDEGMYAHAKKVGEDLVGEANVHHCQPTMGAEDFSFYSQKMPGAFFWLGIKNETLGSTYPLHSPYFFIDEQALPIGAALHAAVAMAYLDNHSTEV